MTTTALASGVVAPGTTVRVEVALVFAAVRVTLVGASVQLAPAGHVGARLTVPAKPPVPVTVTCELVGDPLLMEAGVNDADATPKSCAGAV